MNMCNKCSVVSGLIFLVLGVLFLLVDLKYWDFWGVQWWTALFLWMGLVHVCKTKCADCCDMPSKKKK